MRGTSIPLVLCDECWHEVPLDEAEWIGDAIDRHTGRPYPVFLCYSCLPGVEEEEEEDNNDDEESEENSYL